MKGYIFFCIIFFYLHKCHSQQKYELDVLNTCKIYENESINNEIYRNDNYYDIPFFIKMITKSLGVDRNFFLINTTSPNVYASTLQDRKYVFFNYKLFENIKESRKSYWTAMGIFTHQIVHHILEHDFSKVEKRLSNELEADQLTGYILAKLNANIIDVQSMFNNVSVYQENNSQFYPNTKSRIEAIKFGWEYGKDINKNNQLNDTINKEKKSNEEIILGQWLINKKYDDPERFLITKNITNGIFDIYRANYDTDSYKYFGWIEFLTDKKNEWSFIREKNKNNSGNERILRLQITNYDEIIIELSDRDIKKSFNYTKI